MLCKTSSLYHVTATPGARPPGQYPELAFMGRSNCGKSSLINALCGRKNLARTSNTPGKTRTINFFLLDQAMLLVDLPGYGYAKVSKTERESWKYLVESYLEDSRVLAGACILMDFRRTPQMEEEELAVFLARRQIPSIFVLTKADKFSGNEAAKQRRVWEQRVGEGAFIVVSTKTGKGLPELEAWLLKMVGGLSLPPTGSAQA